MKAKHKRTRRRREGVSKGGLMIYPIRALKQEVKP